MTRPVKGLLLEKIGKPVKLEHPERDELGDYAFFAKDGEFEIKEDDVVEKIERVKGFVNIRLQSDYLVSLLPGLTENLPSSEKTAVIEYSSPNIAKPFGIGHLRSTIIGQALYNFYRFLGWTVVGDNHVGDWGTQFGKLLYMIDKKKTTNLSIDVLEELYVEFHKLAEKDKKLEEKAREWFWKLESGDRAARQTWEKCVEVSQNEFDRIYDLLGVKIDNAYGESFYEATMLLVIEDAKKKQLAKKSEGALVIQVEGIKTPLMLVKSDGATTYATRDLATLKFRQGNWHPDLIVYEVGAEQTLHFQQVFGASKALGYVDAKTQLVHTKHGLYLGEDGKKFSTREGKTVKLTEVLEEAVERAKKFGNVQIAKSVGIGAVKYFDLSHNVQSDIIFDWDNIMALEGNSGPYLQYTHARCHSVIEKAGVSVSVRNIGKYDFNPEEAAILRYLYRFQEAVAEAAERFSPNLLCNYLFELAQRYNTFYNKHSVLSADTTESRIMRLELTEAVGRVIKKGLGLLGIEAPERM